MILPGIAEEWTRDIPDEIQHRLDTFRADGEVRVITNPRVAGYTIVLRHPECWTHWHCGQILRGWAIIGHWEQPLRGMGDADRLVAHVGGMRRLSQYANEEQAADEIIREMDDHEAKAEKDAQDQMDDWFDATYPANSTQREAFLKDVDRGENAAAEYNSTYARRRRRRGKVKV